MQKDGRISVGRDEVEAITNLDGLIVVVQGDDAVLVSKAIELIPDDDGLVEAAATLSFRLDQY